MIEARKVIFYSLKSYGKNVEKRPYSKSLSVYIDRFKPKIAIITSLDEAEDGMVKKVPLFSIWRYVAFVPETKMQLPEWYKKK